MTFKRLALIFGNCLFPDHRTLGIDNNTLFFMAEDYGLCNQYKYHKHKLVLLLCAMRSHRDKIAECHKIEYFELNKSNMHSSFEDKITNTLKKNDDIEELVTYEIENRKMRSRINNYCKKNAIKLTIKNSPGFLTTLDEFREYTNSHSRFFMNDFYIWQRKRLGILLTKEGKPEKGRWSFDSENRKKLPKNISIPEITEPRKSKHYSDVSILVEELFSQNPGSTNNFIIPTTRDDALKWFEDFLKTRFANFGPYEDAISKQHNYLFHSYLSPLLNIGLLTSDEVVSKALEFSNENTIPYQSLEGFIRQIIGWREFIRGVYNYKNSKENFFGHSRKLSQKWYQGTTGLIPLDCVIKKVIANSYAHHIERLMIISSVMLMTEISPKEVYKWFMELFIDSSHWVMEPNVYGMGLFADGGSIATKPYISGSNYILKMSDFQKGEWCDIWDGLYWRFIDKNRNYFSKNHRMSIMVSTFDKMDKNRKNKILNLADKFIYDVTN